MRKHSPKTNGLCDFLIHGRECDIPKLSKASHIILTPSLPILIKFYFTYLYVLRTAILPALQCPKQRSRTSYFLSVCHVCSALIFFNIFTFHVKIIPFLTCLFKILVHLRMFISRIFSLLVSKYYLLHFVYKPSEFTIFKSLFKDIFNYIFTSCFNFLPLAQDLTCIAF